MAPSHLSDRPLVICEVLISSPQECTTSRRRMGLYACCALRSCLPHEDEGFESLAQRHILGLRLGRSP
jgi:hypothetical protein